MAKVSKSFLLVNEKCHDKIISTGKMFIYLDQLFVETAIFNHSEQSWSQPKTDYGCDISLPKINTQSLIV